MPHRENLNDSTKANITGLQTEISSAKQAWSRPQHRRLNISYETAGGTFTLADEISFPLGPES